MKKFSILIITFCLFLNFSSNAQMRDLNELINLKENGWEAILQYKIDAKNKIEILDIKSQLEADSSLYYSQVTTRSLMGAIIYNSGGILINNGILRILGSGNPKLNRSIIDWNLNKSLIKKGQKPPYLLIADDVFGGFFAINGGGISREGIGKVFYFAPDSLKWEQLNDFGYNDFIWFSFSGDLDKFYQNFKWKNFEKDLKKINGNQGFHIYPPLWSEENKNLNNASIKSIPIQELWDLYFHK